MSLVNENMNDLIDKFKCGEVTKQDFIHQMHDRYHKVLFEFAERIGKTHIQEISIQHGKVSMTFSKPYEMTFRVDPVDERMIPIETINFGSYENQELSWILKLAEGSKVIFDIGANIGFYSVVLSKSFPESRIFSFEPIPQTFSYLSENIKVNEAKNVSASNSGLSDHQGILKFYFDIKGSGNASARKLNPSSATVQEFNCSVDTLDNFLASKNLDVDFIKCDVEGAELLVLKGAQKALTANKPIVFLEMLRKWSAAYDYHPNDIIQLLKSYGYQCFFMAEDLLVEINQMTDSMTYTNFFFLHTDKHAHLLKKYKKLS